MLASQEILSRGSDFFNQIILLSHRYGTNPNAPNYFAHAESVLNNLLEEANEFLKEKARAPYSPDYYKEAADFVFCANTMDKLNYCAWPFLNDGTNKEIFFHNCNKQVYPHDVLPQPISREVADLWFDCEKLAIPYPYALAVTLSNASKFFTADEKKISEALHYIETKRPKWRLFQSENWYFFSEDGKVQKASDFLGSGYIPKERILTTIWGNLAAYYEKFANPELQVNMPITLKNNLVKCTNDLELANAICATFFSDLMARVGVNTDARPINY